MHTHYRGWGWGGGGWGGGGVGEGMGGWEEGRESFHRFHLSPRLCPSTAGRSPPSMSSIVFCLLHSCSRWFPPLLLCLAIICLVVLLISSLSLVATVVFLSCPLVKKHADLSGSFLYSQSTMKNMYSKPTNRTKLSIPMKTKSIA